MGEAVLRYQFQEIGSLAIVATLIMAICEFHLNHAVHYRTVFSRLLQMLNNLILFLLRQFIKLVKRKVMLFYSLLLTSAFCNGIRLLIILQRLKGVILPHATVASLYK